MLEQPRHFLFKSQKYRLIIEQHYRVTLSVFIRRKATSGFLICTMRPLTAEFINSPRCGIIPFAVRRQPSRHDEREIFFFFFFSLQDALDFYQ